MRIFVINLDSEKERLSSVDAQMRRLGLRYERIAAVYAQSIPAEEKRLQVDRFRWWCAMGRPIRTGEIGCQMSHQLVYRKIIDEKIPVACVLEDDVILDERFAIVLNEVEKLYDKSRPQIVLLSNHCENTGVGDERSGYLTSSNQSKQIMPVILKKMKGDMFAEGYVLGTRAARSLLDQNLPMKVPADFWGRWVYTGAIELYHAYPTVCRQDKVSFSSGTRDKSSFDVNELQLHSFCIHKLKRLLGKALDKLLMAYTGK